MTSSAAVRAVIETVLKTWADANGVIVEWENESLVPPNNAAYLQFFMLPAPARSIDLAGAINMFLGVVQINVVGIAGGGPGDTAALASQIEALYPAELSMTDGTITVTVITPASSGRGIPDIGRYVIPVSFQYRCYA